ncbi:hypothetical protein BDQ17DRAFT_1434773 [Cyathus striatus]|nr:hypothetical protein BDQ17DRAFT_1434773 [Cyathus striatus]
MSQIKLVVSSIEEQTSEPRGSEAAATSVAPMVQPGEVGNTMDGMGETPAPFVIPQADNAVESAVPAPPVFHSDQLNLAVKWGLLDETGLSTSLGTRVTRSSHSKTSDIRNSNKVKDIPVPLSKNKKYSDVARIHSICKPVIPTNEEALAEIKEPPIIDKDRTIKIEVVDEYIEHKGFIKPKKTIKSFGLAREALESLPKYFPIKFGNEGDQKALKEVNVIEHPAATIKEIFGRSPDSPFDDIFHDITGTGELYLDEYIVPLPPSPTPSRKKLTERNNKVAPTAQRDNPLTFPLSQSSSSPSTSNISSFTTSNRAPEFSDISDYKSDVEIEDLQRAISNSLVTYQKEHATLYQIPVNAILVEVQEAQQCTAEASSSNIVDDNPKTKDKGKQVDPQERGAGYDELFNNRKHSKSKHVQDKKVEFGPSHFKRERSELPSGGYFRATMEEPESEIDSFSPNGDGGDDGSDGSSSDSSDSSSSDSSSSSSGKSNASGRSKNNRSQRKRDRQRKEYKKLKKALNSVKIKTPFTYDGHADLDNFDQWTYEVDTWSDWNGLSDRLLLRVVVNFMSYKASRFFMKHIATHREDWTIKRLYEALFDYCFPPHFKQELRDQLLNAKQGRNNVRDFL